MEETSFTKSHFLRKSILFIGFSILILAVIVFSSNLYLRRAKSYYRLDKNTKSILFGHSHVARAYNDSIIPNIINLAQPGDSYFYIYLKINQLISSNPEIENVFIEFTNNMIDTKMDEWIWSDTHLNYKYRKLSAFANIEDHFLLLSHNFRGYVSNASIAARKNLLMSINTPEVIYKDKDWGGFSPINRNDMDSLLKHSLEPTKKDLLYKYKYSNTNILYLKKSVVFLKYHQKKIYLIRTPLHERHHFLNNENKLLEILSDLGNDVVFLDFKDYPLNNNFYADYSHLNNLGADDFSGFFSELLKLDLIDNVKPQILIDSLISQKAYYMKDNYLPRIGYKEND